MGGVSELAPELDGNLDDLHHREIETEAAAEKKGEVPFSDAAFGATKEPEVLFGTAASDIKALDIERRQREARELVSDAGRLNADSRQLTSKYERPDPWIAAQSLVPQRFFEVRVTGPSQSLPW